MSGESLSNLPPADGAGLDPVVAARVADDPFPFLAALASQGILGAPGIRVHLAHEATRRHAAAARRDGVSLHACPQGTSVLRPWGRAIAESGAAHVAVLDTGRPPAPGWLDAGRRAISEGDAAVYGPVEPGWPVGERAPLGALPGYRRADRSVCERLD